jgi:hypothetical protein
MEVVNVGTVSVDDAIEVLLDPENLNDLIGGHGALCFALAREMTAPGFYAQIIENSATIDATTRKHIAFIIFYGERSAITYNAGTIYHRCRVQGFSVSTDRDINLKTKPNLPYIQTKFDPRLGDLFRYSPFDLDRPTLSQKMSRASQYLMERYSVPEEALPCLLFVDASDPAKGLCVRLSPRDPLNSLYDDALKAISQEFAELSHFWKKRDDLKENRCCRDASEVEVHELPKKISAVGEKLRDASKQLARYELDLPQWEEIQAAIFGSSIEERSVCSKIEHIPCANLMVEKIMAYQDKLAEAAAVESKMQELLSKKTDVSLFGQLKLENIGLEKRLCKVRQSIQSKKKHIYDYVSDTIKRLESDRQHANWQIEWALYEKKNLERRLDEARAFLNSHSTSSLDIEERHIAQLRGTLQSRGYGDEVLTSLSPTAFSVIRSLKDRKRIGVNEMAQTSGARSGMKILFLAANPLQTTSLDLEEELRSLEQELRGVKFRESITLIARHAVRPDDLIRHVRADKPTVIHFSGHGSEAGIILRDDKGSYQAVEGSSLKRFLADRGVDLVVLNACYSKTQVDTINGAVKAIVGTTDAVGDEAARRFTVAFYRALGDGLSVREAFRDGGDAVALHGLVDVFHSAGELELNLVSATTD